MAHSRVVVTTGRQGTSPLPYVTGARAAA